MPLIQDVPRVEGLEMISTTPLVRVARARNWVVRILDLVGDRTVRKEVNTLMSATVICITKIIL